MPCNHRDLWPHAKLYIEGNQSVYSSGTGRARVLHGGEFEGKGMKRLA